MLPLIRDPYSISPRIIQPYQYLFLNDFIPSYATAYTLVLSSTQDLRMYIRTTSVGSNGAYFTSTVYLEAGFYTFDLHYLSSSNGCGGNFYLDNNLFAQINFYSASTIGGLTNQTTLRITYSGNHQIKGEMLRLYGGTSWNWYLTYIQISKVLNS